MTRIQVTYPDPLTGFPTRNPYDFLHPLLTEFKPFASLDLIDAPTPGRISLPSRQKVPPPQGLASMKL